uniref:Uncharacterized protein n=1 Tax=Glossina pallidipes TaxID=7398 RepID=A0A1B0GGQ5_GLOPL
MISSDDDDYDGANAFVDDSDDPTVWYSSQYKLAHYSYVNVIKCFHDDDDNDDNGVDNTSGKVSLFAVDFQLNFVLFNLSFHRMLCWLAGWLAGSLADCPAHVGGEETRIVHRKQNE